MLRKIISIFCITAAFVCSGIESATVVAEGFFCEAVKDSFSAMALNSSSEVKYVLTSKPAEKTVLMISKVKPAPSWCGQKYAVYGNILLVNHENSFRSITLAQAQQIMRNEFLKWPGVEVKVPFIAVVNGALPRHQIEQMRRKAKIPVTIYPDSLSAADAVSGNVGAIAILPLGYAPYVFGGTRMLSIDNIAPTPDNVFGGKYPLGDLYYISISPQATQEIQTLYKEWTTKKFRRKILKTGALPIQ